MQSKLPADKTFAGLGQPLASLGKMFPVVKNKHLDQETVKSARREGKRRLPEGIC